MENFQIWDESYATGHFRQLLYIFTTKVLKKFLPRFFFDKIEHTRKFIKLFYVSSDFLLNVEAQQFYSKREYRVLTDVWNA